MTAEQYEPIRNPSFNLSNGDTTPSKVIVLPFVEQPSEAISFTEPEVKTSRVIPPPQPAIQFASQGNTQTVSEELPGNELGNTGKPLVIDEKLPMSARDVAIEILQQSNPDFDPQAEKEQIEKVRRNISNWFKVVRSAFPWTPESELRLGSGKNVRFTPSAIALIMDLQQFMAQGRTYEDWKYVQVAKYKDEWEAWNQGHKTSAKGVDSTSKQAGSHNVEVIEGEVVDPDEVLSNLQNRVADNTSALSLERAETTNQSQEVIERLKRLQELLRQQHQTAEQQQTAEQERWRAEARAEALNEFLFKEEERQKMTQELEQLRRGKPQ